MSTPPLSACRRAGDLLFLSGQLGMADGAVVEGGIEAETRQVIRNIEAVLAEHGATLESVVKNTVYLASLSDWPAMNGVYAEEFGAPYPARSAVGVELVRGALVEIEAIAYVPV
jgi:2-iminobutanoate/2-iminopropanoate deaminase